MAGPWIWAGNYAKALKSLLNLNDSAYILTGTADPSSSAQTGPQGSQYMRTGASGGALYLKQDAGSSTNWMSLKPVTTKGDLFGFSTTTARVPVGADGTILTADSTQALGVKWSTNGGAGSYVGGALTTRVTATPSATGEYRTMIRNGSSSFTGTDNAPTTAPSGTNGMKIFGGGYTSNGVSGDTQRWEIYIGTGARYQMEFYASTGRTGFINTAFNPGANGAATSIYGLLVEYDPTTGVILIDAIWSLWGTDSNHYVGTSGGAGGTSPTGTNASNCYFDIKVF